MSDPARPSTASAATEEAADRVPARAWAAFALGCLCFGYAFLQRVAPSVMTEELMRDFSVGGAALGSLTAFYFYAYAGMQLPIGVLIDRFGPRRPMAAAMALCTLASLLFVFSDSILVASLARGLIGGAVAFCYVGTMTIAAHWFPARHFPLMVGLLMATGMLGAVSGQAPLRLMVDAVGWRDTVLTVGLAAAALALGLFLVLRDRPERRKTDGRVFAGIGHVLKRRDTWACAILGTTMAAPMLAFAGLWAVPWLVQVHGYARPEAAASASLVFIGWGVSGPVYGWLSGRFGRRKPLLYAGIALSVGGLAGLMLLPAPTATPAAIAGFLVMLGIGGSAMVLAFPLVREANRPSDAGSALGFVNMCVVASGAVFQPLIGYLLDRGWDGESVAGARVYSAATYDAASLAFFAALAAGLVACLAVRESRGEQLVAD